MSMLGIKHNFTSIAVPVIIVWYEATNPLAEVGRVVIPVAHVAGAATTITGLNTTVYKFAFHESSDSTTLETLIDEWSIQVKEEDVDVEFYHYVVGRGDSETNPSLPQWADPAHGDTSIVDERWADAYDVNLFSAGAGPRQPWEFTFSTSGGFTFTDPDQIFEDGDKWMACVTRRSSITTPTVVAAYDLVKIVSTSEAFGSSYYNKVNIANFSGLIGTTTFLDASLIPNGTKARFTTYNGSQRYWVLQFAPGNTALFAGENRNYIALGKDEEIEIFVDSSVIYVTHYKGNYQLVGQPVPATKKDLFGTGLCDGSSGVISEWIRLIDELPAEMVVSYADWDLEEDVIIGSILKTYYKNRGKFAVDTLGGTFKFPEWRGESMRFLLKTDATTDSTRLTQGAGGKQAQNLIQHKHEINPLAANNNLGVLSIYPRGTPYQTVNQLWTANVGGTEQAVDNLGFYGLVYI